MGFTEVFWLTFPTLYILGNVIGWSKFADWYLDRRMLEIEKQ